MRMKEEWEKYREDFYPNECIKIMRIENKSLLGIFQENNEHLKNLCTFKTDIVKIVNLMNGYEIQFNKEHEENAKILFFRLFEETHLLLNFCEKNLETIEALKSFREEEKRNKYKIDDKLKDVIEFMKKCFSEYEKTIKELEEIKKHLGERRDKTLLYISKEKVLENFYWRFCAIMEKPLTERDRPKAKIRELANKIIKEYFKGNEFSKDIIIERYIQRTYNISTPFNTKYELMHSSKH